MKKIICKLLYSMLFSIQLTNFSFKKEKKDLRISYTLTKSTGDNQGLVVFYPNKNSSRYALATIFSSFPCPSLFYYPSLYILLSFLSPQGVNGEKTDKVPPLFVCPVLHLSLKRRPNTPAIIGSQKQRNGKKRGDL